MRVFLDWVQGLSNMTSLHAAECILYDEVPFFRKDI